MCISVPQNTNGENIYKLSILLQIVQPSRKKKIVIKFGMLDFTGTYRLNIITGLCRGQRCLQYTLKPY